MITAIQSLGKYHKFLLGALLAVTIISFVFFGAWTGAQSGGGRKEFLGVNLQDPRACEPYTDLLVLGGVRGEIFHAEASRLLSDFLLPRYGRGNGADSQLRNNIIQLDLATQAQIPTYSGKDLRAALLRDIKTEDNSLLNYVNYYLQERYRKPIFLQAIKTEEALERCANDLSVGLSSRNAIPPVEAAARVERYFANTLRMSDMDSAIAGPGYVVPFEALLQWRLENSVWEIETATLPAGAFQPEIKPDETALAQYYKTVEETYRIPPIVSATYAEFTPTEADSKDVPATAEDRELETFVRNNHEVLNIPGLDYRNPEVFAKLPEHIKDTNGNRALILKAWRDSRIADNLAARIVGFIGDRLPLAEPASAGQIQKFLAAEKATEHTLPAFHSNAIPSGLPVPPMVLKAIFDLNAETWRSNPFPVGSNVVVFFHKKTEPARIPALAEVRDRVVAAYVARERASLFTKHAIEVGAKLKTALDGGTTFAEAATALGFKAEKPAPFKMYGMPENLRSVAGGGIIHELSRLPEGGLTPILRTGPDALYARLIKKTEPEGAADSPEVKSRLQNLAFVSRLRTQQSIVGALFPAPSRETTPASEAEE